jgi:hypothetical protein
MCIHGNVSAYVPSVVHLCQSRSGKRITTHVLSADTAIYTARTGNGTRKYARESPFCVIYARMIYPGRSWKHTSKTARIKGAVKIAISVMKKCWISKSTSSVVHKRQRNYAGTAEPWLISTSLGTISRLTAQLRRPVAGLLLQHR